MPLGLLSASPLFSKSSVTSFFTLKSFGTLCNCKSENSYKQNTLAIELHKQCNLSTQLQSQMDLQSHKQ